MVAPPFGRLAPLEAVTNHLMSVFSLGFPLDDFALKVFDASHRRKVRNKNE
jgi:hypothetical protein